MKAGLGLAARTIAVLGIPVRFESNAEEVLLAAEDCFGWAEAAPHPAAAARVRIRVREGEEPTPARVLHRVPRVDLLLVRSAGSRGYADASAGRAVAEVTRALLGDREHFRRLVLESLTLFLVTRLGRPPLHAAAVTRGGTALLLAGGSGVGKSSLAWAAHRAGMEVLSEDAVYLQLDAPRVWGIPRTVHLLEDSVRFFPELAGVQPVRLANGKTKLALKLRLAGPRSRCAERAAVCLVARGPSPRMERVPPGAVLEALTARMEPGFDHFRGRIEPALRRLAAPGGWRLVLPPHPADTIPLLEAVLEAVRGGPALPEAATEV